MRAIKLTVVLLAIILMVGCRKSIERTMLPEHVTLMSGDIVLRCGSGITSRAVQMADGGGSYSHVGIVIDSAGILMIVHAVPDEHDSKDDIDRVKMDSPEKFFSSVRTSNGRVMRFTDSTMARKAADAAYAIYRRGTLFDHDYDASDTTMMYCCELVEHAYNKVAGISVTDSIRHDVNLPAFNLKQVMLPSDFIRSSRLKTIATF